MTAPPHPGAGAFVLGEAGAPRVVLFHGLTGAPSELWPLAVGLAAAGYRVEAPLLPGHGATPEVLARTSADDVTGAARRVASDPGIAVIGGLSMGALLAVIAASGRAGTRAVVLLASALQLEGRNSLLVGVGALPVFRRLKVLVPKGLPDAGRPAVAIADDPAKVAEMIAARVAEAAEPSPGEDGRYDRIPLRWGGELARIQRMAARAAPGVGCPALLLHGLKDRTASPEGSLRLAQLIGHGAQVRLFPESAHLMALGPERGAVAAEVVRFLNARNLERSVIA